MHLPIKMSRRLNAREHIKLLPRYVAPKLVVTYWEVRTKGQEDSQENTSLLDHIVLCCANYNP